MCDQKAPDVPSVSDVWREVHHALKFQPIESGVVRIFCPVRVGGDLLSKHGCDINLTFISEL